MILLELVLYGAIAFAGVVGYTIGYATRSLLKLMEPSPLHGARRDV